MANVSIGERVKDLRTEKKLTLKELSCAIAEKTGRHIAVSTLSTLEAYGNDDLRKVKEPSLAIVKAVADFFEVSLDYLVGNSDAKSLDVDVQAIHKRLGLSEQAIAALYTACKIRQVFSLWALNVLLQDENLLILDTLGRCLSMDDKYTVERIDGSHVREKTIMVFEVQQLISRMIDKVHIDQNGIIRVEHDGGVNDGQH